VALSRLGNKQKVFPAGAFGIDKDNVPVIPRQSWSPLKSLHAVTIGHPLPGRQSDGAFAFARAGSVALEVLDEVLEISLSEVIL
jgi:hypothetical protein